MVFEKFITFIYSFILARERPRIKSCWKVADQEGVLESGGAGISMPVPGVAVEAGGEVCCVCLSRMNEGEEMRVLRCLHKFHKECVDRWLGECRKSCPVCRLWMGEEDQEHSHKRADDQDQLITEEMVIWFSSFHVGGL